MTEDDVRTIIREELASIAGHLLAAYGRKDDPHPLAVLGGYLLSVYGDGEDGA